MKLSQTITINQRDVKIPTDLRTRLRWKEYQILLLLLEKSPEVLTRAELIDTIWKGTYCSDSTINQTIKSIRQKIGDENHQIIKTIPRIGYIIEEKQRITINSDEEFIAEISPPEPQHDTSQVADISTGKRSNIPLSNEHDRYKGNDRDEELYCAPIWALPSHSRSARSVSKTSLIRSNKLKSITYLCLLMIQHKKNEIVISFLGFFVFAVVILCSLSILKAPISSYTLGLANLSRANVLSLTCPLGYGKFFSDEASCEHYTTKFAIDTADCQAVNIR